MSGSRRERQLTGGAANSHSRPGPAGREWQLEEVRYWAIGGAGCHLSLKTISRIRANIGVTTGTVSMVLATAISSNAVNASLVMIALSSSTLAKMIMINALV